MTPIVVDSSEFLPFAPRTERLNRQRADLLAYLREVHHADLHELARTETPVLIYETFQQFALFLGLEAPLQEWIEDFQTYVFELMEWLTRPLLHAQLVIRSVEFTDFALSNQ